MHIYLSARPRLFASAITLGVLVLQPVPAVATTQGGGVFHQRNLVSDILVWPALPMRIWSIPGG
jgi:hypothetical protein